MTLLEFFNRLDKLDVEIITNIWYYDMRGNLLNNREISENLEKYEYYRCEISKDAFKVYLNI